MKAYLPAQLSQPVHHCPSSAHGEKLLPIRHRFVKKRKRSGRRVKLGTASASAPFEMFHFWQAVQVFLLLS